MVEADTGHVSGGGGGGVITLGTVYLLGLIIGGCVKLVSVAVTELCDYFDDYSVSVVTDPSSASDYLESEVEPIETRSVSTTVTLASPHRKTNGSKTRTNDKHTRVRSGSPKNRAKQKSGWKYRGNKSGGPIDLTPVDEIQ